MTAAVGAAVLGLAACLGVALLLARRQRERLAFLACVLAPLAAALAYALVAGLAGGASTTRSADSGSASIERVDAAKVPLAAPGPAAAGSVDPGAASQPGGVATETHAWRTEAAQLRSARNFAAARELYARIVNAAPRDADAWADFADASAAAAGGDLNAGAVGIEHALRIDPDHPKALWLKASLELQERRYASAAALWQRLLAQLPGDSNDARIVRANLDEAHALAGRAGAEQ